MKRYNILFLLIFILSGCCSAPDNISDRFDSFKPRIAPDKLAGIWTVKIGSDLWTLKINNNGTGVSCYSYQGTNGVDDIKYYRNGMIVKNGIILEIESFNSEQLVLFSSGNEGVEYLFVKDDGKNYMSQFCFDYFAIW